MRSVIYCRVSSDRQVKEGHGLDSQETLCRNYAKDKGYKVIGVFREEGVKGGLFERKAMKELLLFLEKHDDNDPTDKIVVIFDDLKRFARDVPIHFKLKAEIYSRNGTVESPNFRFEDTPEGTFVETVVAATGALERDQNRRQVLQKMKARLQNGYWPFMPPLGLVNKEDKTHGKLLTGREPIASLLKEGLEKFRDGLLMTPEELRAYWEEEFKIAGITTKSPTLSTVQIILRNPLYAGYIEYKPWGIPFQKAKHDGVISIGTFNLNQKRLQRRTKPYKRKDNSKDFPLRPHVLCNACGVPMTGNWNKGRNERYPNYYCRTKGCIYCWKTVRKYKLEAEFEVLLASKKPLEEDVDLAKDVLQEQWTERLEKHVTKRGKFSAELREISQSIESFVKRVGKTTDEDLILTYEETIKELRAKKKELEKELNKESYTSEEFGTASEKVLNTLKKPMSMWKSDEYDDKRIILFMYFEEDLRYDYKLGFGTADLAYPVQLIASLGQAKNGSVEMSVVNRVRVKVS